MDRPEGAPVGRAATFAHTSDTSDAAIHRQRPRVSTDDPTQAGRRSSLQTTRRRSSQGPGASPLRPGCGWLAPQRHISGAGPCAVHELVAGDGLLTVPITLELFASVAGRGPPRRSLDGDTWRRHCASGAGGDSRIDRVHRNTPYGSAPWGDTAFAAGPLRLAVAAMPQQGELGPGHDDDRPSACYARRFAERWQHLHRGRSSPVDGRRLCQVQRPKATTRCRCEVDLSHGYPERSTIAPARRAAGTYASRCSSRGPASAGPSPQPGRMPGALW